MKSYSIFLALLMTVFSLVNLSSFDVTIRLQEAIPSSQEISVPNLNFPIPKPKPLIIA
jgi:hypothetical protein